MSKAEDRGTARRLAVQNPRNASAMVGGVWPPESRIGLVQCAKRIKHAMILMSAGLVTDRDDLSYVRHVGDRVRRSIEYLQYRDRRLATSSVWTVRASNGRTIRFPLTDPASKKFKEIVDEYEGGFEHALNDFVIAHLRPGDVFVDIGAHIGYTSAFAATTGAMVFAIEIQRDLIPLIEQMASINAFDQLRVLHAGMSAQAGLSMVQRTSPHPGFQLDGRTTRDLDMRPNSITNDFIPVITLDDTFGSEDLLPSIVKVDVEGHEIGVLEGARRIIEQARTIFVVEFHPHLLEVYGRSVDDLLVLFDKARWTWWQLTDQALRPIEHPSDIEPDPNDPNPKLVFRPRD